MDHNVAIGRATKLDEKETTQDNLAYDQTGQIILHFFFYHFWKDMFGGVVQWLCLVCSSSPSSSFTYPTDVKQTCDPK